MVTRVKEASMLSRSECRAELHNNTKPIQCCLKRILYHSSNTIE